MALTNVPLLCKRSLFLDGKWYIDFSFCSLKYPIKFLEMNIHLWHLQFQSIVVSLNKLCWCFKSAQGSQCNFKKMSLGKVGPFERRMTAQDCNGNRAYPVSRQLMKCTYSFFFKGRLFIFKSIKNPGRTDGFKQQGSEGDFIHFKLCKLGTFQ